MRVIQTSLLEGSEDQVIYVESRVALSERTLPFSLPKQTALFELTPKKPAKPTTTVSDYAQRVDRARVNFLALPAALRARTNWSDYLSLQLK